MQGVNSFFLLLLSFISAPAISEQCKVIKAACSSDWFPVSFSKANGQPTGIAPEMLKRAAKDNNLSVSFNCDIPWKRSVLYMDQGKIDVLAGHYMNAERNRRWQFFPAVYSNDIRVFFNRNVTKEKQTLSFLPNLVGIKPAGASFGDTIDKTINDSLRVHSVHEASNSLEQLVEAIQDYAILSKEQGLSYISRSPKIRFLHMSEFSMGVNPVHISMSKSSSCLSQFKALEQSFIKQIDAGVAQSLLPKLRQEFNKSTSL